MAILNVAKIKFDVNNPTHRELYWNMCKKERYNELNKFRLEPGFNSVYDMIKEKTVEYYLTKEFNELQTS